MRKTTYILLLLGSLFGSSVKAQQPLLPDSLSAAGGEVRADSLCADSCQTVLTAICEDDMHESAAGGTVQPVSDNEKLALPQPKRPWRAAIETVGLNVGVWAFDRYVMQEDFAKISLSTIKNNIRHGFVWDNDQFSTNLFAHPYHGNLYFNTARSSGMTFWESAPYAFAGSLMWETCAEVEPPAINDLMATTLGGIALGEMTFRMSSLVLDDSRRGFPRFLRELLGSVLCPPRAFNRLLTGEAWRVTPVHHLYHDYDRLPVKFEIGVGNRYLADAGAMFRGEHNPYIELRGTYGSPFDTENNQPYDHFTLGLTMGLSGNQPMVSRVNLMGRLWGTQLPTSTDMELTVGLFQYFNYFDAEEVADGTGQIPYKLSEAASIGPGMVYRFPGLHSLLSLSQSLHIGGILLGGCITDYYNIIDRNYNLGSGYSVKSVTHLDFGHKGMFSLGFQHYRIFTWKGYEGKDLSTVNPLYLNAQGDRGNTSFTIITPITELALGPHLRMSWETSFYFRRSHYRYHPDLDFDTFETRVGLMYHF